MGVNPGKRRAEPEMNKLRLVAKIRFYTEAVDFSNVSVKLAAKQPGYRPEASHCRSRKSSPMTNNVPKIVLL